MSFSAYPAIALELRPSRVLFTVTTACHLLALVALLAVDLSWPLKSLLGALIGISCWFAIARLVGYGGCGIVHINWRADGSWRLRTARDDYLPARLLASYTHPYIMILRFAIGRGFNRTLVITPDAVDNESLRRLRVRLRLIEGLDDVAE